MKHNILGIDISKAKFDVALLASGGQQLAEFTNAAAGFKRLNKWLKRHQARQVHACLEASRPVMAKTSHSSCTGAGTRSAS